MDCFRVSANILESRSLAVGRHRILIRSLYSNLKSFVDGQKDIHDQWTRNQEKGIRELIPAGINVCSTPNEAKSLLLLRRHK